MVRDIIAAIVVFSLLGFLLYSFIYENAFFLRKRLLNKKNARPDAVIEKVEPVLLGSKRNKHYVILVSFSDGTSYMDKANVTSLVHRSLTYNKYRIQVDNDRVQPIIEAAIKAHKKAVKSIKNTSSHSEEKSEYMIIYCPNCNEKLSCSDTQIKKGGNLTCPHCCDSFEYSKSLRRNQ